MQPGKSDAANTAIERGLGEGEQVVTQPSDLLRDGMRVKSAAGPTTGGHSMNLIVRKLESLWPIA